MRGLWAKAEGVTFQVLDSVRREVTVAFATVPHVPQHRSWFR